MNLHIPEAEWPWLYPAFWVFALTLAGCCTGSGGAGGYEAGRARVVVHHSCVLEFWEGEAPAEPGRQRLGGSLALPKTGSTARNG